MDIFDRIASEFQKEARIPKGDTKAYEEWKKNLKKKNPEAAEGWDKYEGAFDPSTGEMNQARIEENESSSGSKKASFYDEEIIDDIGLERVAGRQWGGGDSSSFGYHTPEERETRHRKMNPTYKEVKSKNERRRIRDKNLQWNNAYYAHPMESASSEEVKTVRLYTGVRDVTEIPAPRDEFPKPSQMSLGVEVAPDLFLFHRSQKPIQNISPTRDPQDYVLLKSYVPYSGGLSRRASFYDEEIIDDIGLERTASFYDEEIIDDIGLERVASEDFFFQR